MKNTEEFLKNPALRPSLSTDHLYRAHDERMFANPPWSESSARFLILRLSPFRDVERSTPHEFLFREVRQAVPDAYIDFGFFPSGRDRAVLTAAGQPWMHGIASGRGGAEFDVILISNSYTLELVNLVPYLAASGLPVSRMARECADEAASSILPSRPHMPLVVLGGSNAMASAAIYDEDSGDSIVDAVFFGEGEGAVSTLVPGLAAAAHQSGPARCDSLVTLSRSVRGFWPTSSRDIVLQSKAASDAFPPGEPPLLAGEESGTARLEITRGCPSFCTFCFEGWERKPFRERPLDSIMHEALLLKEHYGADSIELASYNFNAHSRIVDIIQALSEQFMSVSFQSQRIDILARSPGLIDFEIAAGKRSFTVGVEGISSRSRAYFNKGLSEGDLRAVLERIIRQGVREIKLFYILSGFEDEADLSDFSGFVAWLHGVVSLRPSAPRIMFSAGELIRMPFTPLAYERLVLDEAPFAKTRSRFTAIVTGAGFEARSPELFDEYCLSQILALSPKGSLGLLLALAKHGHVYDRNLSKGAWDCAHAYLEKQAMLDDGFLDEKPQEYPFAYAHLRPLVDRSYIYKRFLDAKAQRESSSCLGSSCVGCGACDDDSGDDERHFLSAHTIDIVTTADMRDIEKIVAAKAKPLEAYVRYRLSPPAASAPPAYAAAMFRRELYESLPALAMTVWTAEDAFLTTKEGLSRLPGASGDSCYRILSSTALDTSILTSAGYVVLDGPLKPLRLEAGVMVHSASMAETVRMSSEFLTAMAIPFTLRKKEGRVELMISEKGRKKRNIMTANLKPSNDGTTLLSLSCGVKYDLGPLSDIARRMGLVIDIEVTLGK